ncbi:hypothetical protein ACKKBF_B18020 [Auxenochlorella protothecoides x Auxenochlorella symbiontica]
MMKSRRHARRSWLGACLHTTCQSADWKTPAAPKATAKEAALRLLNLRRYPAKKLTEKLLEKGHPPDSIEQALHDLEKVGLTGDAEYAEVYVRSKWRQQLWSPRKLQYEMKHLGIDQDHQKAALSAHFGEQGLQLRHFLELWRYEGLGAQSDVDGDGAREAEAFRKCQARLELVRGRSSAADIAKFYGWLQRRGFSFDEARLLYDACQQLKEKDSE